MPNLYEKLKESLYGKYKWNSFSLSVDKLSSTLTACLKFPFHL